MRAAATEANTPLDQYTLMPTHMRSRFSTQELAHWEPADPLPFTKGLRLMRMPAATGWMNPWRHGTLLFDLETDPAQHHPLADDEQELRMLRLLARLMHENDAPASQFERLGLPFDTEPCPEHLLVRAQAARATTVAEPLPSPGDLPATELLDTPLLELLQNPAARTVIERHVPGLVHTELLTLPPSATLLRLARLAIIPTATVRALAEDLASNLCG